MPWTASVDRAASPYRSGSRETWDESPSIGGCPHPQELGYMRQRTSGTGHYPPVALALATPTAPINPKQHCSHDATQCATAFDISR